MADEESEAPKDEVTSVPDLISDLVSESAVPGIPAPVRKNLLKAFGQLCSAAIEVPAAHLTGIADERRAETAARIKLINVSAEQIARQMQTDPEYARIAAQKFGQRVIREQVNLDLISQNAASEIRDASDSSDPSGPDQSDESISDDWLNAFETEARQKSTEEMQALFGRILAGEIRRPGTFSTRTIRILGSLDQNTAELFVRLCSMCVTSQSRDTRVPSLGGNAGDNALQSYGMGFSILNLLNEHGLVISDYNSWYEFTPCSAFGGEIQIAVCVPLSYQGKYWNLMPMSSDRVNSKLRIHGVALTQSGRELSNIVELEPLDSYSRELGRFYSERGFQMIEVGDGRPQVVSVSALDGSDSR